MPGVPAPRSAALRESAHGSCKQARKQQLIADPASAPHNRTPLNSAQLSSPHAKQHYTVEGSTGLTCSCGMGVVGTPYASAMKLAATQPQRALCSRSPCGHPDNQTAARAATPLLDSESAPAKQALPDAQDSKAAQSRQPSDHGHEAASHTAKHGLTHRSVKGGQEAAAKGVAAARDVNDVGVLHRRHDHCLKLRFLPCGPRLGCSKNTVLAPAQHNYRCPGWACRLQQATHALLRTDCGCTQTRNRACQARQVRGVV